MLTQRQAGVREKAVSSVLHLYPFLSGCGTLANCFVARQLVPESQDAVWARVRGAPCLVPLNDLVGRAIFLVGDLDRKITAVIDRCVRVGDIVMDVGANLGLETLILANKVGPGGRVHAFEPSPPTLAYLEATLAANPSLPVTLHRTALGDAPGKLSLEVPVGNAGRASLIDTGTLADTTTYDIEVQVAADVVRAQALPRIDFVKIDVEGFEHNVLKGMLSLPKAQLPRIVLFEEHDPARSQAIALLKQYDFRIWGIAKRLAWLKLIPVERREALECQDFVALRTDAPAEAWRNLGLEHPNRSSEAS